jgi:hypothetical protein
VDHRTYRFLCHLLGPSIQREDTRYRDAWEVQMKVGIALYRLGHGSTFVELSHLFGPSDTFCNDTCREVFWVLWEMRGRFITWGPEVMKIRTMSNFHYHRLPACIGAIDGCHLPMERPPLSRGKYRNRKDWYSILLSAVVDHDRRFVHVDIGMPGSNHDAHVYRSSRLYGLARGHFGVRHIKKRVRGDNRSMDVRPYIIGDPAYPISPYLMKGFPGANLSLKQEYFNYTLSASRMKVEQAFGIYKKRWKLMRTACKGELPAHVHAMTAACVLHNICIERMKLTNDAPEVLRMLDPCTPLAELRAVDDTGRRERPDDEDCLQ